MAAGLPDLATLADLVADRLRGAERTRYRRLREDRNLEQLLSHLRLMRSLLAATHSRFDGLTWDQAAALDRAVSREIATLVGTDEALPIDAHERLAVWLGRSQRPSPVEVFTTNYDVLVERALERRGVPYFDGFTGVFRGEYRADLVDGEEAPEQARPPVWWVRLWKLHSAPPIVPRFRWAQAIGSRQTHRSSPTIAPRRNSRFTAALQSMQRRLTCADPGDVIWRASSSRSRAGRRDLHLGIGASWLCQGLASEGTTPLRARAFHGTVSTATS